MALGALARDDRQALGLGAHALLLQLQVGGGSGGARPQVVGGLVEAAGDAVPRCCVTSCDTPEIFVRMSSSVRGRTRPG